MKGLLLFIVFGLNVVQLAAQSLSKNSYLISFGVGAPNIYKDSVQNSLQYATAIKDSAATTQNNFGPVCVKVATSIHKRISLGLNINVISNEVVRTSPFNDKGKLQFINAMLRGNYYLPSYKILHPYLGAGLGFARSKEKLSSSGNNYLQTTTYYFSYEATTGLKAYINEHFAIYGELGLNIAPVQIGLVAHIGN
jgi:outer membrane protein W